ncbi:MAG: sigma-54-dependent Fis family transcriptional regulator [Bdellovibrionales bacterium]|nr:sigma-54-dependent Fis family transcriptional regulator [Bdellovibrionales bacterium]
MPDKPMILVVDDEKRICRSLEILLSEEGQYRVKTATDYYAALDSLKGPVDLVVTDLTMPGKSGLELLCAIKKEKPDLPVILMTAYSTVESAVTAIKEGANDYIQKPFDNDELLSLIHKVLMANHKISVADEDTPFRARFGDMIGNSRQMQDVYRWVSRAAETDSTVLISGESGTGKELVAKAIHFSGSRKSKAFIAINCAALPENLLESELFGHRKGAFTGALRDKEGKFELADHGTLFLDEIGEMPLNLQSKLLRVLQEKEFERVGDSATIKVNVRIIAASNRNLENAVIEKLFREDLFYRLNVLAIHVPPLRERREDLPLLIDHFLEEKARRAGVLKKTLSKEAASYLLQYDYPGNIRELENMIERAVVISQNPSIELEDFPAQGHGLKKNSDLSTQIPMEEGLKKIEEIKFKLEKEVIERALKNYPDKSNSEIAELLGTSRRILEMRLKRYNITKSS